LSRNASCTKDLKSPALIESSEPSPRGSTMAGSKVTSSRISDCQKAVMPFETMSVKRYSRKDRAKPMAIRP
jgi:hypothetical protein